MVRLGVLVIAVCAMPVASGVSPAAAQRETAPLASGTALPSPEHPEFDQLLRQDLLRLPQWAGQHGGRVVRRDPGQGRSLTRGRARRHVGESGQEASRRCDAARRVAPSRCGGARSSGVVSRDGARSRGRAASEARPPLSPSLESSRVRERDSRPAGGRGRRLEAAASGRFGGRLRQQRRPAQRVARAARALSLVGGHD